MMDLLSPRRDRQVATHYSQQALRCSGPTWRPVKRTGPHRNEGRAGQFDLIHDELRQVLPQAGAITDGLRLFPRQSGCLRFRHFRKAIMISWLVMCLRLSDDARHCHGDKGQSGDEGFQHLLISEFSILFTSRATQRFAAQMRA